MRDFLLFLAVPFRDTFRGLDRCLGGRASRLFMLAMGLLVGWWLYVPVHELLHALACWATGGTVTNMEVSPLYGGQVLEVFLPFVTAGGEYAGRLAGFDTRGSDVVYLMTVMGPYFLTLWPGVWLLRLSGSRGLTGLFGLTLPLGLAPFLSLTGDTYELGSILVTLGPWASGASRELYRGDDVFKVIQAVNAANGSFIPVAMALILGGLWALSVYGLGAYISRLLGQGPVPAGQSGQD